MFTEHPPASSSWARSARRGGMPAVPVSSGGGAGATAAATAALVASRAPPLRSECPPDREALGAATWTILHAMAAYYPESPSREERAAAAGVIGSLALLYPCMHCRERLKVGGRRAVGSTLWMHPPGPISFAAMLR